MKIARCDCGCERKSTVEQTGEIMLGGVRATWRRRKCPCCGQQWRTMELPFDIGKEVLADD